MLPPVSGKGLQSPHRGADPPPGLSRRRLDGSGPLCGIGAISQPRAYPWRPHRKLPFQQVLLLQEAQPEKALEMVERAMELAAGGPSGDFSYDWRYRLSNLISAGMWAQKAWALALLNREAESRDAIEIASRSVNAATAGTPNSIGPRASSDRISAHCCGQASRRFSGALA